MSNETVCECGDTWCGYGDPMGYEDKDTLNHFMRLHRKERDAALAELARERTAREAAEATATALRAELEKAREEVGRLRAWADGKAAYYAQDAKELNTEGTELSRRGEKEDAAFRFGCADYARGFAAELRHLFDARKPEPTP